MPGLQIEKSLQTCWPNEAAREDACAKAPHSFLVRIRQGWDPGILEKQP